MFGIARLRCWATQFGCASKGVCFTHVLEPRPSITVTNQSVGTALNNAQLTKLYISTTTLTHRPIYVCAGLPQSPTILCCASIVGSDGAIPETFIVVYLKRLSRRRRQISASLLVKRDGRESRRHRVSRESVHETGFTGQTGETWTGNDVDFQLASERPTDGATPDDIVAAT